MNFIAEQQHRPQQRNRNLYFILQRLFQSLAAQPFFLKATDNNLHFKIALKPNKKVGVTLNTIWIFTEGKQLKVSIELFDQDHNFMKPNGSVSIEDIVSQLNVESQLGTYFVDPNNNNSILHFTHMIPLLDSKNFLCSDLSELYSEVSDQFTRFACKLQLIPFDLEKKDLKSQKLSVRFRKLRYLKQHFQLTRYHRDKSTKYLDLTSSYIKIISEVIKLKNNEDRTIISYYKAKEDKSTLEKREQGKLLYENIKEIVKKQIAEENFKNQPQEIAKGITVRKVISEVKIGEGTFGEIYRGKYVVECCPTFNPDIKMKNEGKQTKLLAKKKFKNYFKGEYIKDQYIQKQEKHPSCKNEQNFLKYIRSQKHNRFSGYYFPRQIQNNSKQKKYFDYIFINYYRATLKEACSFMTDKQLLRACMQVLEGICFLADKSILHRDLKETNILVDNDLNVKFIDFGSCCGVYTKEHNLGSFQAEDNLLMSTPGYYLPYDTAKTELPLIEKQYTKDQYYRSRTFDVYSFGSILKNIFGLTRQIPDHLISRELMYLASKCQQINPADRITAKQAQCYFYQIIQLHQVCCQLEEKQIIKSQKRTDEGYSL